MKSNKKKLTFFVLLLAITSIACTAKKSSLILNKNEQIAKQKISNDIKYINESTQKIMINPIRVLPEISQVVMGYIESGTLGGSVPNDLFPSVYHYSNYDSNKAKDAVEKAAFQVVLTDYLDNTLVNDMISLRAYLLLLLNQDQAALEKVHQKAEALPKGSRIQHLPMLFFAEASSLPRFQLNPHSANLRGNGTIKWGTFMSENAEHFSSEIPDLFFQTHYRTDRPPSPPIRVTENYLNNYLKEDSFNTVVKPEEE